MGEIEALRERSGGACELCEGTEELDILEVSPHDGTASTEVLACMTCRDQVAEHTPVDPTHWFCLQASIWSEHPPVQVTAYRMLGRLAGHSWAADLRDQVYLTDDVRAWAVDAGHTVAAPVDSNGTTLADGDSVTLIKDLDVKGANFTAKRGTMVKNIRTGDDPGLVEGKVNGTSIYLKTEFLKRA